MGLLKIMNSTMNSIFHFSHFDTDYPTSRLTVTELARVYCKVYNQGQKCITIEKLILARVIRKLPAFYRTLEGLLPCSRKKRFTGHYP
jgi:hypothetical protein